MSEQKYYVQLNKDLWNNLNPLQLGGVGGLGPDEWGYGEYFITEYEPESVHNRYNKNSFAKSELSEIMDGAFYKLSSEKCNYCLHSGDTCGDEHCEEWINPLIELVPVEEE